MTTFQGVPPGSFAFFTNRDGRLSSDKSPYKLWTRSTSETRALGGIRGYYLEVAANGIVTGDGAE